MLNQIRYIFLGCLMLISTNGIAQLAMPHNVFTGVTRHYNVTPNLIPGSTYTWKVDGVVQLNYTTNEIDITWPSVGNFLLEVQEKSITGCLGMTQTGNIFVTAPIAIDSADLAVVKTVNNNRPTVGRSVVFTIIATNNGPKNATGVSVAEVLQSGYVYLSSTSTNYNPTSGLWTIGALNKGVSETLTLTVAVNPSGNYVNRAIILGNEVDGDLTNNTSETTTNPWDFLIPEGFSPNGDLINDVFVIRGILNYPNNMFTIFNRWGNKVFEASPYQNNWDGRSTFGIRLGGDKLPIGTYFYVLDLKDGTPIFKGTIYLNR